MALSPEVHIHIDTLEVHGLGASDVPAFRTALADALAEHFSTRSVSADLQLSSLDAGRMAPGARPAQIGRQVARAVARSVGEP